MNNKTASLTFRGFDVSPEDVESWLGVKATYLGVRGYPVRSGVKTTLNRSAASFSVESPNAVPLHEMIPALLAHVGGVDHLCNVRDKVKPEYLEIDLALPIKFSEEQEGGAIWPRDSVRPWPNQSCSVLSVPMSRSRTVWRNARPPSHRQVRLFPIRRQITIKRIDQQRNAGVVAHDQPQFDYAALA